MEEQRVLETWTDLLKANQHWEEFVRILTKSRKTKSMRFCVTVYRDTSFFAARPYAYNDETVE
jgi:hypothetical protein